MGPPLWRSQTWAALPAHLPVYSVPPKINSPSLIWLSPGDQAQRKLEPWTTAGNSVPPSWVPAAVVDSRSQAGGRECGSQEPSFPGPSSLVTLVGKSQALSAPPSLFEFFKCLNERAGWGGAAEGGEGGSSLPPHCIELGVGLYFPVIREESVCSWGQLA